MMRYLAAIFFVAVCGLHFAAAGILLPISNFGKPRLTYQGPGDVESGWLTYWSPQRCWKNSTTGISIVDIVDAATGNTTGTRLQCGTGNVITALVSASACTFVTGNACSPIATTCTVACVVVNLYDQTGNGVTLTQATNARRPTYTPNCQNSLGCMVFASASTQWLGNTTCSSQAQPYTVATVANFSNTTATKVVFGCHPGTDVSYGNLSSGTFGIFAGSTLNSGAISTATWLALQGVYNGASSTVAVNTTTTSGSAGSGSLGGTDGIAMCALSNTEGTTDNCAASIAEMGITTSGYSATLATNQRSYWNF